MSIKVYINNTPIEVKQNTTVLQACEKAGIEIPRFCYHPSLLIAGNCRMCLVEIKGSPKPVASCAMPTAPNQEIFTNTPIVKKAREAVLEFLLMNHPLDCPICDQGGECDIQDQVIEFGSDKTRFYNNFKRSVEDKNCGPLVKTIMTRCIHCTRCIRFSSEVAGVSDLGTTGRGIDTEVGFYIEKLFDSELSGNVIDLCPVGALTSKPYAFNARPWEISKVDTIDFSDSLGSHIQISSKALEIVRVTPRHNDNLNFEWISDKTRFFYDGLNRQRLTKPYLSYKILENEILEKPSNILDEKKHLLVPVSWELALRVITKKIVEAKKNRTPLKGISGSMMHLETLKGFKLFCQTTLGSRPQSLDKSLRPDINSLFQFNTPVNKIEKADFVLNIGTNIRIESPVLNTRFRRSWIHDNLEMINIGPNIDLTYPVNHLGITLHNMLRIKDGLSLITNKLKKAKNPLIIISANLFRRKDKSTISNLLKELNIRLNDFKRNNWNPLNVLDINANLSILGFESVDINRKRNAITVLLNPDDRIGYLQDFTNNIKAENKLWNQIRQKSEFLVYIGHHGSSLTTYSDIILPSLIYTEQTGSHYNLEGRVQKAPRVTEGSFSIKNENDLFLTIEYIVSRILNKTLEGTNNETLIRNGNFNFVNKTNSSQRNNYISKYINEIDRLNSTQLNFCDTKLNEVRQITSLNLYKNFPILPSITNFYQTDNVTRQSALMADCSKRYKIKNFK